MAREIETDEHGWPIGMKLLSAADVWIIRMAESDQVIGYLVPDDERHAEQHSTDHADGIRSAFSPGE